MAFDDARERFYLQHRDQLQEWFDLRPSVAAAIDAWLMELDDEIRGHARDLGADVKVSSDTGDGQARSFAGRTPQGLARLCTSC